MNKKSNIKTSRTQNLHIRVSAEEQEEIERRAEAADRTVSDYVRLAALGKL